MKFPKTLYVSRKNVLTVLSVILIFFAVAALFFTATRSGIWREHPCIVVFLALAQLLAATVVLLQGEELFYRTAVPVAFACLFEVLLSAPSISKLRAAALIILYACVALVYALLVSGKIGKNKGIPFLVLAGLAAVLVQGWPPRMQVLPQVSALAALIVLCLAMQEHDDGQYHRTWGDRSDGRLVRSLDPMTYVGVYSMPNRNGANTLIQDTLDVTDVDHYIHAKRREDIPHLSLIQIFLTAFCRAVAEYPALNRFISGEKIYSRDGDIIFNMTVKKKMTIEGGETLVKLHLTPEETLYTVSEKLEAVFREGKEENDSDFDKTAGFIRMIPGLLKKFTFWLLKTLDFFGLVPGFLLEVSPFHGSIYFTSMASLGIPPVFHHLYDFGNVPIFLCMGDRYKKTLPGENGTLETRKYLKFTINSDERICDGFYYSRGLKALRRYILHPELLEVPPKSVKRDLP